MSKLFIVKTAKSFIKSAILCSLSVASISEVWSVSRNKTLLIWCYISVKIAIPFLLQLAAVDKKCPPRYTLTQNLGGELFVGAFVRAITCSYSHESFLSEYGTLDWAPS